MRNIFAAGVFVVMAIAAVYVLSTMRPTAANDAAPIAAPSGVVEEMRSVPDGWREYRSSMYLFSLLYPQELAVNENPEGGNATTITFQNTEKGVGFQIFVVPYQGQQVSEERFKKDIPSGVRTDLVDIVVDGVTGAAFYSSNAALGETREIWFIKDGYLYEVTTLKPLDAWLKTVMQSWKFL